MSFTCRVDSSLTCRTGTSGTNVSVVLRFSPGGDVGLAGRLGLRVWLEEPVTVRDAHPLPSVEEEEVKELPQEQQGVQVEPRVVLLPTRPRHHGVKTLGDPSTHPPVFQHTQFSPALRHAPSLPHTPTSLSSPSFNGLLVSTRAATPLSLHSTVSLPSGAATRPSSPAY